MMGRTNIGSWIAWATTHNTFRAFAIMASACALALIIFTWWRYLRPKMWSSWEITSYPALDHAGKHDSLILLRRYMNDLRRKVVLRAVINFLMHSLFPLR